MQFPPVSSFFDPLRPKYLPQYSSLKHLQLMFLPQYEKPRYKSIQNNMRNHSSVQFLQTDRQQMGIQEIHNQIVASTP